MTKEAAPVGKPELLLEPKPWEGTGVTGIQQISEQKAWAELRASSWEDVGMSLPGELSELGTPEQMFVPEFLTTWSG